MWRRKNREEAILAVLSYTERKVWTRTHNDLREIAALVANDARYHVSSCAYYQFAPGKIKFKLTQINILGCS